MMGELLLTWNKPELTYKGLRPTKKPTFRAKSKGKKEKATHWASKEQKRGSHSPGKRKEKQQLVSFQLS